MVPRGTIGAQFAKAEGVGGAACCCGLAGVGGACATATLGTTLSK
jgi:hypothetical protein